MENKFTNRTLLIAGTVIVAGSLFIMYQWSLSNKNADTVSTSVTSTSANNTTTEDEDTESKTNTNSSISGSTSKLSESHQAQLDRFPVQVFVRVRPLIKEEIEAKHEEMKWISQKHHKKTGFASIRINSVAKGKSKGQNSKIYHGFQTVLKQTDDNVITFKESILPNLPTFFDGNVVCSFAYGHTGSGKSHTMLGYSERNIPGMYELTAKYIFEELNKLNASNNASVLLEIRFAELYQGKMRDLFSKDLVECHVREGVNGKIHIRGPTIKNEENGQVLIQPLTGVHATKAEEVIEFVNNAKKQRNVGSSTKHDESSRSHAFLDFELVTQELVDARNKLVTSESELVPHGKARDGEMILIESSKYAMDPATGQYTVNEAWVNPDPEKIENLEKMVKIYQEKVDIASEKVDDIIKTNKQYGIGGTVVFVDLAGNEWGQDSKTRTGQGKDTPQQARERTEINKSLLCLKECIRGLHNNKKHVPYRDSKLTMVLRPHLKGESSTAIMIANVSPSQEDIKKTLNTLQYSQLVAQA